MGLEKVFTEDSTGISIPTAYFKIINVSFQTEQRAYFQVGVFSERGKESPIRVREYQLIKALDQPAATPPTTPFADYFSIEAMNPLDANIIKNAYEYLKTLEEYADATDVLEE